MGQDWPVKTERAHTNQRPPYVLTDISGAIRGGLKIMVHTRIYLCARVLALFWYSTLSVARDFPQRISVTGY